MYHIHAYLYLGGPPQTVGEDTKTIVKELDRSLYSRRPYIRENLSFHVMQAIDFRTFVGNNYSSASLDYESTTSAYASCYCEFEHMFEKNPWYDFNATCSVACHWYYFEQNNILHDDHIVMDDSKKESNKEVREYYGEREAKRQMFGYSWPPMEHPGGVGLDKDCNPVLVNDSTVSFQPDSNKEYVTGHTPISLECDICMEKSTYCVQLNSCTHKMCYDCYKKWNTSHANADSTCPTCRAAYTGCTMIPWQSKKYSFRWSTIAKSLSFLSRTNTFVE